MADITPLTSGTFFNDAQRTKIFQSSLTATPASFAKRTSKNRFRVLTRHFTGITANQVYTVPRGVCAVAWQANETTDNIAPAFQSTGGTNHIRFFGAGGGNGWLHMMIGGAHDFTSNNELTPSARGTAGYTQQGFIFLNHRDAAPNTLTAARRANAAGMNLQMYPFTVGSASDRWVSQSAELAPSIVAVAWQSNNPAGAAEDQVAVTLDAAGDVIFTGGAAGGDGWLWAWRRRL